MYFPPFRGFVKIFAIACASVFVLQQFALYGPLSDSGMGQKFVEFFGFSPNLLLKGLVFQLVTWVFIHGNLMHLIFNLFAFWMFGSLLQDTFGTKRFVFFNLWAAIFTAGVILCFSFFDPPTFMASTIGASGLVFAILIGVAKLFPNQTILFAFIFPMKMKYFAYLMIAIEFYFLYTSNNHGISNIGHLGGALFGWIYVTWLNRPGQFGNEAGPGWKSLSDKFLRRKKKKHLRIVYPEDRTRYQ